MPLATSAESVFGPMKRRSAKAGDPLGAGFYGFCPRETWAPAVNLYETTESYLVCVDLAGVVKDEIELSVERHRLMVRGTRAVPQQEEDESAARLRIHLMEIDHGPFCREVELPDNILEAKIEAVYRDGLLWITLPKKART
jgi:HSP20 family protein